MINSEQTIPTLSYSCRPYKHFTWCLSLLGVQTLARTAFCFWLSRIEPLLNQVSCTIRLSKVSTWSGRSWFKTRSHSTAILRFSGSAKSSLKSSRHSPSRLQVALKVHQCRPPLPAAGEPQARSENLIWIDTVNWYKSWWMLWAAQFKLWTLSYSEHANMSHEFASTGRVFPMRRLVAHSALTYFSRLPLLLSSDPHPRRSWASASATCAWFRPGNCSIFLQQMGWNPPNMGNVW